MKNILTLAFCLTYIACQSPSQGENQDKAPAPAPAVALKPPFNIDSLPLVDVVVNWNNPDLYAEYVNYFEFYDKNGQLVQRKHIKDFPSKHPLLHLDFPLGKDTQDNYFKPYGDFVERNNFGDPIRSVAPGKRTREFKKLEKYGLKVKNPETAEFVQYYGKRAYLTYPACKYLIVVESASVFPSWESAGEYKPGQSDALLEASWMSVYNAQGKLIKDFPIPDRGIDWAFISDDAQFILCQSQYFYFGQDDISCDLDNFVLIDTDSNQIIDIAVPPDLPHQSAFCIYADNYFQFTRDPATRIYINPYKREMLTKSYDKKGISINLYQSFSGFKGIVDDLSTFDTIRF